MTSVRRPGNDVCGILESHSLCSCVLCSHHACRWYSEQESETSLLQARVAAYAAFLAISCWSTQENLFAPAGHQLLLHHRKWSVLSGAFEMSQSS